MPVAPTELPGDQADPVAITAPQPLASGEQGIFRGRSSGLIIAASILVTVIVCRSDTFLSAYTLETLAKQIAIFSLIALAQAICLGVGGMNLSVGAMGGFCTVALGILIERFTMTAWLAVPVTLLLGAALGWINGEIITRLKIDSFIVTLSMMFIYMGLKSGISGGSPYQLPNQFSWVGQDSLWGIPLLFIVAVMVLAWFSYLLNQTVTGRYLLATGGNAEASRLSGVNTSAMIVIANIASGFLAALVAILWASKNGSAAPEAGGDWLIISFAVAIIGGTGLAGGVISISGILMGATIFALIKYALVELKINDYYANSFLGGLILLTIVIDRIREAREQR